ncbi:hypothetical protein C8Q76DRAFT_666944 [Earliella scabrosa]|nr:hypothetical protein C8Q76DRAFT_666944 [Earliella scabrosa]
MSTIPSNEFTEAAVDLPRLLEGHHRQSTTSSGEIIHVFAITGAPVFGSDQTAKLTPLIEIPLWGLVFILRGTISRPASGTFTIDATFSVRIPIFGEHNLSKVRGSLDDGVDITWGISGVLSGTSRFYGRGTWLWVDIAATVFGHTHDLLSMALIPL